jgi:hypothetical protein
MLASAPPAVHCQAQRPSVRATAPERYRVQFTIGRETHERLRRLQALLRREVPDGDPGVIFDRAIALLLEKVEGTKLAMTGPTSGNAIRPGTDSRSMTTDCRASVWQCVSSGVPSASQPIGSTLARAEGRSTGVPFYSLTA